MEGRSIPLYMLGMGGRSGVNHYFDICLPWVGHGKEIAKRYMLAMSWTWERDCYEIC